MSSPSSSIILLDANNSSLTVSWPTIQANTKRYILQYRENDGDNNNDDKNNKEFVTLSDKLTSTQARKRNLSGTGGFFFRVALIETKEGKEIEENKLEWVTHDEPFVLLTNEEEKQKMEAPMATPSGYQAALLSWKDYTSSSSSEKEIKGYEVQMRENNGGIPWNTVASCFPNTQVRKKNLISHKNGYQFRIRPVFQKEEEEEEEENSQHPFSAPSEVFLPPQLSSGLAYFFRYLETPMMLLQNQGGKQQLISLQEALVGKEFILLYISAHWCGPCRSYTPQLVQYYNSFGRTTQNNNVVEIIFCSADHDEHGFRSYYNTMPWLAIRYDDDGREQIMSAVRVTGIPRLVVLDGKSGRIVEENAVGQSLDVGRWRRLVSAMK